MSWLDDTLRQFGQSIGIDNLGFNARGVCCLSLQERGDLYIEKRDEEVFIYLARKVLYPDEGVFKKALSLSHFRNSWPLPVVAGLRGEDHLIFLTRVGSTECSLPVLEQAIRLVTNLHKQVQQ
jgi:type III secretion system chaperone SycN